MTFGDDMQHATMSQSGWVTPFPCPPPLTTMRCAVACEAFVRPGSSWILSQCWAGGGSQLNLHRWGRLADRVSNGGKNLLESRFIYSCSKPLYESKFGIWTAFVWNFKPIDLFLLRTQSAASISDLTPRKVHLARPTHFHPSIFLNKNRFWYLIFNGFNLENLHTAKGKILNGTKTCLWFEGRRGGDESGCCIPGIVSGK